MSADHQTEKDCTVITILHFNDCYNIEPRTVEPSGGAARFKSALDSFRSPNNNNNGNDDPVVLFSGDILGPSIMSTFTKGEQMIPVLNHCETACAVFGNHDFDYGLENLVSVTTKTNFPWLMSNVYDIETGRPLADGRLFHVIYKNGKKLGIIGLVEEEWLATLATIDQEDVRYNDFISEGRKYGKYLKEKEKVDYVIALTHMRMPNDVKLAENVDEIDIILGGHDHDYDVRRVNDKYIIKSGTDFRTFSKVDLIFNPNINKVDVNIREVQVNAKDFPEDQDLKQELEKYSQVIDAKMDLILGQFSCDLDGRFASIRTQETNLG